MANKQFVGNIGHLWVAYREQTPKVVLDTRGSAIHMNKRDAKELRDKLDEFINND